MDTAPKAIILSAEAQRVINEELEIENFFNEQRRNVLTFSQDALECSATSPNMSSASPQVKKRFSISGTNSPLSGSGHSSPKNIRITEVDEKTEKATFHKFAKK